MDRWLRRSTPLILLVLAGLAWFEKFLPGHAFLAREFGDMFVLRFVLGVLCLYVLMLVIERQRMEQLFKRVLGQFKSFHDVTSVAPRADAEARQEAVQILIAALGSSDPKVRAGALGNLQRLTGESLGEDQAAWQAWLAKD